MKISEQKTTLLSLRKKDCEKVTVKTRKVNKVLHHILTDCITKLKELGIRTKIEKLLEDKARRKIKKQEKAIN